jgi:hypothetical protein
MITEETISIMSEKVCGLKSIAESVLEELCLLEHRGDDYMKLLNEKDKYAEILSCYADDIEGYINGIESDISDISYELESLK